MAFEDGLGDRGTVPEGKELAGECHDLERVRVAGHLDSSSQQAARDGSGVEEDPPLLRPELQEFQSGQPGDLQRAGERAGVGERVRSRGSPVTGTRLSGSPSHTPMDKTSRPGWAAAWTLRRAALLTLATTGGSGSRGTRRRFPRLCTTRPVRES